MDKVILGWLSGKSTCPTPLFCFYLCNGSLRKCHLMILFTLPYLAYNFVVLNYMQYTEKGSSRVIWIVNIS